MTGTLTPQDEGMGASDADFVDAAAVGQLAFDPNASDVRISGMNVSADFANGEVTVATGVARLSSSTEGAKNGGDRSQVQFVAEITASITEALANGAGDNYVYLDGDPTNLDTLNVVVNGTQSAPTEPSLLIGYVDANAQTVEQRNTDPDGTYEGLKATDAPTASDDVARKAELDAKADADADAASFGGSSGTSGQVLTSDGTDATWQDGGGGGGPTVGSTPPSDPSVGDSWVEPTDVANADELTGANLIRPDFATELNDNIGAATYDAGVLYCQGAGDGFIAVDMGDGSLLWNASPDPTDHAVGDSYVFVGDALDDGIRVYDKADGTEVAHVKTSVRFEAVVASGGYFAGRAGDSPENVYAFDESASPTQQWTTTAAGFAFSMTAGGSYVFLGIRDGDSSTGTPYVQSWNIADGTEENLVQFEAGDVGSGGWVNSLGQSWPYIGAVAGNGNLATFDATGGTYSSTDTTADDTTGFSFLTGLGPDNGFVAKQDTDHLRLVTETGTVSAQGTVDFGDPNAFDGNDGVFIIDNSNANVSPGYNIAVFGSSQPVERLYGTHGWYTTRGMDTY